MEDCIEQDRDRDDHPEQFKAPLMRPWARLWIKGYNPKTTSTMDTAKPRMRTTAMRNPFLREAETANTSVPPMRET